MTGCDWHCYTLNHGPLTCHGAVPVHEGPPVEQCRGFKKTVQPRRLATHSPLHWLRQIRPLIDKLLAGSESAGTIVADNNELKL